MCADLRPWTKATSNVRETTRYHNALVKAENEKALSEMERQVVSLVRLSSAERARWVNALYSVYAAMERASVATSSAMPGGRGNPCPLIVCCRRRHAIRLLRLTPLCQNARSIRHEAPQGRCL